MHRAGQVPGMLHRQIGVIAIDLHAQLGGGVCHQNADGPQAHNAQSLPLNFRPGKLALALLNQLFHLVALTLQGFHPVHGRHNFPGGQEQRGQHQLFHSVGVGAGGIEHHNALFQTFVNGNVVDRRLRPWQWPAGFSSSSMSCMAAERTRMPSGSFISGEKV